MGWGLLALFFIDKRLACTTLNLFCSGYKKMSGSQKAKTWDLLIKDVHKFNYITSITHLHVYNPETNPTPSRVKLRQGSKHGKSQNGVKPFTQPSSWRTSIIIDNTFKSQKHGFSDAEKTLEITDELPYKLGLSRFWGTFSIIKPW